MFITHIFKDLGISTKTEFEDAEYNTLLTQYPKVSELYKEHKVYNTINSSLNAAQVNLTAIQGRNNNLPDNLERIAELAAFIAAIEGGTLLEQIQLKDTKAEYVAEKERLEAEQTAQDTTEAQARIDTLTTDLVAQKTVVNGLSNGMDMGDIV